MTRTVRRKSFPEQLRFAAATLLVEAAIRTMPETYHDRVERRLLEAVAHQKGLEIEAETPDPPRRGGAE